MPGRYSWEGRDLLLQIKLQPRSSRDEFAGPHDDRLRVRITAPPVDGKANSHLVAWLAKQFGVGKSSVAIEAGQSSRFKRVRIRAPAQLPTVIAPARSV